MCYIYAIFSYIYAIVLKPSNNGTNNLDLEVLKIINF